MYMKNLLIFALSFIFVFAATDSFAKNKKGKRSGSNVYVSKKYKGHTCPKPKKVINAKYF